MVDIALVTQSAVKSNKSEAKINEEKFKRIISNKLSDLFIHCSTVPASFIRILNGLDSKLSDNKSSVDKPDNVNTVIELLHVKKSFRVKAKSIISLLSNRVLEDAIADLSYHKNTEESVREEKAREKEETKYDDEDEDINNF